MLLELFDADKQALIAYLSEPPTTNS
jgi:hypothetical protein